MGDILKKITELLENGSNYEERRSTGIIISNWFDAIDGEDDRQGASGISSTAASNTKDNKERKFKEKSDVK